MRDRLKRLPTAAWVWAFAVYSYVASTICAAWFIRHGAAADAPVSLGRSLLWQGLVYGLWIPPAILVWLILKRFGPGARAILVLGAATAPVTILNAFGAAGIGLVFGATSWTYADWAGRALGHGPVALLLFTAVAMVGLAAAHWQRAVEARDEAERLQGALETARLALVDHGGDRPGRLLVSAGSRRVSVEIRDVEWFASAGNYVVVHWAGREGLMRDTLAALEQRLDPAVFARSHRSSLVNLARVAEARPLSDGSWRLTLASGADLVVSRTHRDAILTRLGRSSGA